MVVLVSAIVIGGFIGAFYKYAKLAELQNDWTEPTMPKVGKPDYDQTRGTCTVVATAGLLYTALTHEPDLAEFDRKELESLIKTQRPALIVDASIEESPAAPRAVNDGLRRARK